MSGVSAPVTPDDQTRPLSSATPNKLTARVLPDTLLLRGAVLGLGAEEDTACDGLEVSVCAGLALVGSLGGRWRHGVLHRPSKIGERERRGHSGLSDWNKWYHTNCGCDGGW